MSEPLYFKLHGQLGSILYKGFKAVPFLSRDPKQCQYDNFQYSFFGDPLAFENNPVSQRFWQCIHATFWVCDVLERPIHSLLYFVEFLGFTSKTANKLIHPIAFPLSLDLQLPSILQE